MHPSHPPICGIMEEDQVRKMSFITKNLNFILNLYIVFLQGKILEAVKAKGVPQLYLPAGDDSPDVYPGGIGEKVAKKPFAK